MNKNTLIVLAGGFAMALLVAMIVSMSLKEEPAITDNTIKILVATKTMEVGYTLKKGDMSWQEWPEANLFEGLIKKVGKKKPEEALKGRLRRVIHKGEPLLESALLSNTKGNIVASSLKPGKRAVAIKVSAASMVGGFISPGDFVDVILTHKIKVSGGDRAMVKDTIKSMATETILENVRVLAIDQNAISDDKDKVKVGRTVTLEVNALGAEELALVSEMGDLSLSLRGIGDDELLRGDDYKPTTDVNVSEILQEILKRSETGGGKPKKIKITSDQGVDDIEVKK
jgi:pilus assembly protein CpaB